MFWPREIRCEEVNAEWLQSSELPDLSHMSSRTWEAPGFTFVVSHSSFFFFFVSCWLNFTFEFQPTVAHSAVGSWHSAPVSPQVVRHLVPGRLREDTEPDQSLADQAELPLPRREVLVWGQKHHGWHETYVWIMPRSLFLVSLKVEPTVLCNVCRLMCCFSAFTKTTHPILTQVN